MPIVVFPDLLAGDERLSVAREIEVFQRLSEVTTLCRFELRDEQTFNTELLQYKGKPLSPGVLTVAALGWDPPERSTHFHVSLLSATDDQITTPQPASSEEAKILWAELQKLNTKSITLLQGEGLDYGLVWERRVDLLTQTPEYLKENGLKASLPEGDLENDLRRLIDDSINILSEQEFNLRRIDQGQKPINLVWPWGHGERHTVANLALRLGYPWRVFASALDIRGLARLSGLKVERILLAGKLDSSKLVRAMKKEPNSIAVVEFKGLEGEEHFEEKVHIAHELGKSFLQPLLDWSLESKEPLTVVASGPNGKGVIGFVREKPSERDHFPFDERIMEERKVPEMALANVLHAEA